MTVLQMSRFALEGWTTATLKQNRWSFRYAVFAMWAGFIIIAVGIVASYGLYPRSGETTTLAVNVVVLASGIVVEVVGALFLWVYRQAQAQFRYFYDRQLSGYTVLTAFDISKEMNDGDAAKKHIIERLVDVSTQLSYTDPPAKLPKE